MAKMLRSLVSRFAGHPGSSRDREEDYKAVCADGDIAVGEIRRVDGFPVVVCRTSRRLYAVEFTCPHSGAHLVKGRLVGECVECPLHGARFALKRGTVRRGPARRRLRAYDVRVRDGVIYVSRVPRHG
jgi:nitrite reductase/ring-hydroxylating ferredoxin subunit